MPDAPMNMLPREIKDDGTNTTFRQPWSRPSGITARVVSQISVTGIDLYCNWLLEILAGGFKLSLQGQQNINNALNNLPVFKTADEKLEFGWTSDHALKNLGVHVELYERLALEVALSETFPERYAAKVLWEMARLYATDQDVIPHFRDMVRIVHSSNGLFTATNFSLMVEACLRMVPDSGGGSGTAAAKALPAPHSMAVALSMLAQITNDNNKQMTVVGECVLAWFAAAAEWLYGLRVAIYLPSGECVHSNHDDEKSQLLLVFNPGPKLETNLDTFQDDATRALEVAAGSMSLSENRVVSGVPFGGRAEWNSLLAQVFGSSFLHLEREETKTFGTVLGASARAQQFLHEDEAVDSQSSNHSSRPVGPALVQLLTDWLPELRRLQSRMERQLKLTAAESRKTYVESLEALGKVCGCALCGLPGGSTTQHASFDYCLTVLVETVVVLGMVLSRLTVAPHIFPTAHGLRNLYRRQHDRRQKALETEHGEPLAMANQVYREEAAASDLRRMQNCAELFSGSRPMHHLPANLVALSHEGICVYLVSVEKKTNRPQDQDLLRVTSGGVGVRFKIFNRAALGPVADADELHNVWEEVSCEHLSQPLYCR